MNSSKTPSKKIVEDFKVLRQNRNEVNRLVINIMAHPDATQEELLQARGSCLRVNTRYKETRASLQWIYPNRRYWRIHPWNEPEEI